MPAPMRDAPTAGRWSDRVLFFYRNRIVKKLFKGGASMAYTIKKVDVWAGEIADRPGGLADKLSALSDAGANFEFLI